MSAPKTARNRRLVAAHLRNPSLSWAELGRPFHLTRSAAKQIVERELARQGREVRKPPRPLTLHPCREPGCPTRFAHRRGYDGPFCPEHRGRGRLPSGMRNGNASG